MINAHSHFSKILSTVHRKLPSANHAHNFCLLILTLSTYIYRYTANYELYYTCMWSFLPTEIFLLLAKTIVTS